MNKVLKEKEREGMRKREKEDSRGRRDTVQSDKVREEEWRSRG